MLRKQKAENPEKYAALVASLKQRIHAARLRASLSVNQEPQPRRASKRISSSRFKSGVRK
jgi:hypothetical protein